MLMRFKGGGPLDGREFETACDVIWYSDDDETPFEHLYRAVRHHPFKEDPLDYFQYAGTRIRERPRNDVA